MNRLDERHLIIPLAVIFASIVYWLIASDSTSNRTASDHSANPAMGATALGLAVRM